LRNFERLALETQYLSKQTSIFQWLLPPRSFHSSSSSRPHLRCLLAVYKCHKFICMSSSRQLAGNYLRPLQLRLVGVGVAVGAQLSAQLARYDFLIISWHWHWYSHSLFQARYTGPNRSQTCPEPQSSMSIKC